MDLTQQLVSQITDPARPGLGKRALEFNLLKLKVC